MATLKVSIAEKQMRIAPLPDDEKDRLAALAEYDALSNPLGREYQDIVDLARQLFDVETALVSLVASDSQFFAAKAGIDTCSTSRDISFCSHAILDDEVMIVPDAHRDSRFFDNPLVTGEPFIRFYAGVPLRVRSGLAIGTFCLLDPKPRNGFSRGERNNLHRLASIVQDKLEMRRLQLAGATGQSRFQQIAATSPDAIICANDKGRISFWNDTAERLFGFGAAEALGESIDIIVPEHSRGGHDSGLERLAKGGPPRLLGKTVELEAQTRDGRLFPIELSLSMWREGGRASFGAIIRDITARRLNEDRLFALAHLDSLTELSNRTVLLHRTSERLRNDRPAAMLMLDLDGFKTINDTMGHFAGDELLKQVAHRLLSCANGIDTVARLGGDEFALLLPDLSHDLAPEALADSIIAAMEAPFIVDERPVHIGVSIGIALSPDHGSRAEDLLSAADLAMYQAKSEGRNCRRRFVPALRAIAISRRAYEGELRNAIEQDEFELYYQPQVDLVSGRLVGAEALLRWRHPDRGLLTPAHFLPALNGSVFVADVADWVMRTACNQASLWSRRFPGFRTGVNLFESQFRSGDLYDRTCALLDAHGLAPEAIELEITEDLILRQDDMMLGALQQLRSRGIHIAFDDFGTGFASLSFLKRYPITRLKIDRSFVKEICTNSADTVIVSGIISIARGLNLEVIAEGVETADQRDCLVATGCGFGQGYLFGRPMDVATFEKLFGNPCSSSGVHALRA